MRNTLPVLLALVLFGREVRAEPPWLEVKSPHFTVVTTSGEKEGRRIAWQFEQLRAVLEQLWPWASPDAGRPVLVLAVRDEATLRSLAPEFWERKGFRPTAVFVTGADRHYTALRTDIRVRDDIASNPYFNAYLGYAHVFINSNFPASSHRWFRRGLAEVIANVIVRSKDVHIGRPITHHLELLRSTARIPFTSFFAVDESSPYATREADAQFFDAQSWILVHYLMFGAKGEHGPKLNRYAGLLRAGRSADSAFQEAFGDPKPYEQALPDYIKWRLFPYEQVPITVQVEQAGFSSRPLTPGASAAVRAGMHVAMGRPAEARALAQAARTAEPSHPGPWEVEGLLAEREDAAAAAKAAYAKAIELGSTSFYAHYRLAQLSWSRDLDRDDRQHLATLLEKTVQLNPEFANGWSFLADTRLELGAADEALELARRAVRLEPNESYHRLALARVHREGGRAADALAEARAGLALATSDPERKNAQELVDFLSKNPGPQATGN